MTYQSLLKHITEYLEYELEEGSSEVKISQSTITDLQNAIAGVSKQISTSDSSERSVALESIGAAIAKCTKCLLHEGRTKTVPGQGSPTPEIMFIGEAPGADEDRQGLAFVGRAGQLLTKMIEAMGYTRDQVFIGNINKCRPPGNRTPTPEEMQTCIPYLKAQIAILKPKAIVALGATAVKGLLDDHDLFISKTRGAWQSFEGIDLMPTYHPAYLLRNSAAKKDVWEDLKAVLARLGRKPPPVKKS